MLKLLRFLYSLRLFNNKFNDDDDDDKGKLLQGAPLDFYRRSKRGAYPTRFRNYCYVPGIYHDSDVMHGPASR